MPATSALTAAVDAALLPRILEIVQAQEAFRTVTGHYLQGGWTHSVIPADGAASLPDLAGVRLPHMPASWFDAGLPDTPMTCALRCDIYSAPPGPGYVLVARVREGSALKQRDINVGPASYLDLPWRVVVE